MLLRSNHLSVTSTKIRVNPPHSMIPKTRLFLFQFHLSSPTLVLNPASVSTLNDHRSGFPNNEFTEFKGDKMIQVSLHHYEQGDGFVQFVDELPSSKDFFLIFEPVSPKGCVIYQELTNQLQTLKVSHLSIPAGTTPTFPPRHDYHQKYWEGLISASKAQ